MGIVRYCFIALWNTDIGGPSGTKPIGPGSIASKEPMHGKKGCLKQNGRAETRSIIHTPPFGH